MKKIILGLMLLNSVTAFASEKNCGKVVAVSGSEKYFQVAMVHENGSFRVELAPNLVSLATAALAARLDVCVNEDYYSGMKGVVSMNVTNFSPAPWSITSSCAPGMIMTNEGCLPKGQCAYGYGFDASSGMCTKY